MSPVEFLFDSAPKTCCEIFDLTVSVVVFYLEDLCSPGSEDTAIKGNKLASCVTLFRHCRKFCIPCEKHIPSLARRLSEDVDFVKFPDSGLIF